jgi:hypothetical protein
MEAKKQRNNIITLLKNGNHSFTFKDNPNKKSSICWEKFAFLCDESGSEIKVTGKDDSIIAVCRDCFHLESFRKGQGTKNFLDHYVRCSKPSEYSPVSSEEKTTMTAALVKYVSKELRPFAAVGGVGFLEVVQCAIELQSKRKTKMRAEDLVCHPTTVTKAVEIAADNVVKILEEMIQKVIQVGVLPAFSIDCWKSITNEVSNLPLR